jgi:AraC-like DNA-binding protein
VYQTYRPGAPLSSFVEHFWQTDEYAQTFAREMALPLGTTQLIIHLGGDEQRVTSHKPESQERVFRESLLRGPRADWYLVQAGQRISRVGIQFTPGGAYPFFAPPASELRDLHEPLDALWGAYARELREQLMETPTPNARFRLLEHALLTHTVRPLEPHPAIEYALSTLQPGLSRRPIERVVEKVGLSHQRFIKLFREEVGLTPKEHWRLRRFLAVARRTRHETPVAWADLAARMGYSDQAHLIHDFRAFIGLSPRAYLHARHPQFWTYIPLADSEAHSVD